MRELKDIKQLHFVGGQDQIIEPVIAEIYRRYFPVDQRPEVRVISSFSHHCCWVSDWPQLLKHFAD